MLKEIQIKRKLTIILQLLVLIMSITGCGLIKNPIAEEYSKETYIIIENVPEDSVYGMRMHILDSEREYEIVEIIDLQYADSDNGFNGDLHFGIVLEPDEINHLESGRNNQSELIRNSHTYRLRTPTLT